MLVFKLYFINFIIKYKNNFDHGMTYLLLTLAIFHLLQNLNVLALTKDQYGTFYDTESYIIYAASQYGQSSGIDSVVSII